MKILVDTNILIDYIEDRKPYSAYAEAIVNACAEGKITGYIAAHSVSNMFYILRKHFSVEERKELLKGVCVLFDVVGIDNEKIMAALDDASFDDFEDCLQAQCALDVEADVIVTRNIKDFAGTDISCLESDVFVEKYL